NLRADRSKLRFHGEVFVEGVTDSRVDGGAHVICHPVAGRSTEAREPAILEDRRAKAEAENASRIPRRVVLEWINRSGWSGVVGRRWRRWWRRRLGASEGNSQTERHKRGGGAAKSFHVSPIVFIAGLR